MPAGVSVVVSNGVAHITPDPSKRGEVARLLIAQTKLIDVDTSGSRKAYIVTEEVARKAGLLDEVKKPAAKKAPAKKAEPKKTEPEKDSTSDAPASPFADAPEKE